MKPKFSIGIGTAGPTVVLAVRLVAYTENKLSRGALRNGCANFFRKGVPSAASNVSEVLDISKNPINEEGKSPPQIFLI